MKTKTVLLTLVLVSSALAGCTGDPDGGGNDEFDAETLQGMIESGLEDFMNNTTVEITTNYYTNETSTITNNVNGSGGVSASSLHALSGTDPGESSFVISYADFDNDLALLVREDAFSAPKPVTPLRACLVLTSASESAPCGRLNLWTISHPVILHSPQYLSLTPPRLLRSLSTGLAML